MAQPQDGTGEPVPTRRLGPRLRAVVTRFAEVACPPELAVDGMAEALIAEFEALLSALPAGTRTGLAAALVAFDQGARLSPRSRGRRFTRLPAPDAEAYFRAILARGGATGSALHTIRGGNLSGEENSCILQCVPYNRIC